MDHMEVFVSSYKKVPSKVSDGIYFMVHNGIHFKYWYDRFMRCWFAVRIIDEDGNESATIDSYTRQEIIELIKNGHV